MKLTAYDLGKAPELPTVNKNRHGNLYAKIKDYPNRKVPLAIAYRRAVRHPEMSLKEACETISTRRVKNTEEDLESAYGKNYVDDLKTDRGCTAVARTWGFHHATVINHRRILNR